jgi:hypothetical protein
MRPSGVVSWPMNTRVIAVIALVIAVIVLLIITGVL